jgi:hypothetical protein
MPIKDLSTPSFQQQLAKKLADRQKAEAKKSETSLSQEAETTGETPRNLGTYENRNLGSKEPRNLESYEPRNLGKKVVKKATKQFNTELTVDSIRAMRKVALERDISIKELFQEAVDKYLKKYEHE